MEPVLCFTDQDLYFLHLKQKLGHLEAAGVIEKVNKSNWAAPIVELDGQV